jgi:hypothetical protein
MRYLYCGDVFFLQKYKTTHFLSSILTAMYRTTFVLPRGPYLMHIYHYYRGLPYTQRRRLQKIKLTEVSPILLRKSYYKTE